MDERQERFYTPPHKKKDRAERQRGLSLGRNRHQACQEGIQPRSTRISFFFLLLKGKPNFRLAFLFVHFLPYLHKYSATA
jgi:hypothetical protein